MVRKVAQDMFDAAVLDIWPSPAAICDFGIDSTEHLGALQHAIKHDGVTEQQLDEALGNGPKLTALIREDNPYYGVQFHTSWDDLDDDDETWEDDNIQTAYGEKGYPQN